MAKNTSKGYNTQEKITIKAKDSDSKVTINATGSNADIDINIIPKNDGNINADGIIINDGNIIADQILVDTLQANNQIVPVISLQPGVSSQLFNVNMLETGAGVQGDGIAGVRIERGTEDDVYIVFDESDKKFKVGEMDDFNTIVTTLNLNGISAGSLYFVGTNGVDFDASNNLIYNKADNKLIFSCEEFNVNTTTTSISGDVTLDSLSVTNVAEFLDVVHVYDDVNIMGDMEIDGDITITSSASSNANVDISGSLSVDDLYVRNEAFKPGGGSFAGLSDKNLKENIKPLTHALEKISELKGVEFNWIFDGKTDTGFIAQEVEKIFPEFVQGGIDNQGGVIKYLSFSNSMYAYLVESIKTLREQNIALMAEIAEIKKQLK